MIFLFGIYYKEGENLLKEFRKHRHDIMGLDDCKTKLTNILLKPYEEENMKDMFAKHKPSIIINYFERNKKGFDNFKYNVVPQKLINKYCPRNCKTIYISNMGVYDEGKVENCNHPLNPKTEFLVSKRQGEVITKERTNHCIIRLGKPTTKQLYDELINIIDNDFRGIINV